MEKRAQIVADCRRTRLQRLWLSEAEEGEGEGERLESSRQLSPSRLLSHSFLPSLPLGEQQRRRHRHMCPPRRIALVLTVGKASPKASVSSRAFLHPLPLSPSAPPSPSPSLSPSLPPSLAPRLPPAAADGRAGAPSARCPCLATRRAAPPGRMAAACGPCRRAASLSPLPRSSRSPCATSRASAQRPSATASSKSSRPRSASPPAGERASEGRPEESGDKEGGKGKNAADATTTTTSRVRLRLPSPPLPPPPPAAAQPCLLRARLLARLERGERKRERERESEWCVGMSFLARRKGQRRAETRLPSPGCCPHAARAPVPRQGGARAACRTRRQEEEAQARARAKTAARAVFVIEDVLRRAAAEKHARHCFPRLVKRRAAQPSRPRVPLPAVRAAQGRLRRTAAARPNFSQQK